MVCSPEYWKKSFGLKHPVVARVRPPDLSGAAEGWQIVVEWDLKDHNPDLTPHIREYGYTAEGYPCESQSGRFCLTDQGGRYTFPEHTVGRK
jgi:hypothetical protein